MRADHFGRFIPRGGLELKGLTSCSRRELARRCMAMVWGQTSP